MQDNGRIEPPGSSRWNRPPNPSGSPSPSGTRPTCTDSIASLADGHAVLLWSTDASLSMQMVTGAATDVIAEPSPDSIGIGLLTIFGLDAPARDLLEAHIGALSGHASRFMLIGEHAHVACRVEPTHDHADRITGTLCLATGIRFIDARERLLIVNR